MLLSDGACDEVQESIDAAVFDRQQGLPRKLNSSWHDWTVLLSGLVGSDAAGELPVMSAGCAVRNALMLRSCLSFLLAGFGIGLDRRRLSKTLHGGPVA